MKLKSKWHFDELIWEYHPKWWKPYVHSFKVETELVKGELRWKTQEQLEIASKDNIYYWGYDGSWIFHWLGFEISFLRY